MPSQPAEGWTAGEPSAAGKQARVSFTNGTVTIEITATYVNGDITFS